jgi:predicted ArsR family transcriptional regulator
MANTSSEIEAISLLDEPVRRRLFDWLADVRRPVGRDEAAAAMAISRALAAFHLDRMAAAGLLDVEYRRLSGRTGPGAGRPAKLYRRSNVELQVSLPLRRYVVPGAILASALETSGETMPPESVARAAGDYGRDLGRRARRAAGSRPGRAPLHAALLDELRAQGYAPKVRESGEVRLESCPFHDLAASHRDLVCGLNLALVRGVLTGLGIDDMASRLDPQPGACCVALDPRGGT